MEGEFRFVLCLRRRCSFIFHPQPPFLSDCGGGCRDGRCRGGRCRYRGRRREEEEVVVNAVMVDAMVVDMDTVVEDVRRRKWWFSFV
ncbi:hypothetical protein IGI04_005756 [Brassica rapa subsp. trilocularis]|uniref:Uncharacterized protein n=1 Tax=Brassica rapa subsp. trilocularis TaxID=1813537 RepID=A0ABQ7NEW5_BRACM|nr:hypothetical protein IGI04_005756 [Brassica rapa subsp. trilocularis]